MPTRLLAISGRNLSPAANANKDHRLSITIDNVYKTDLHLLEPLYLQNLSDKPLRVRIQSSSPVVAAFQLDNENVYALGGAAVFSAFRDVSTPSYNSQGNGGVNSRPGTPLDDDSNGAPMSPYSQSINNEVMQHDQVERHYNELFNAVDWIDSVHLRSRQKIQLLMLIKSPAISDREEGDVVNDDRLFQFETTECSVRFSASVLSPAPALNPSRSMQAFDHPVAVTVRSCLSRFKLDLAVRELEFDDCQVGVVMSRHFYLVNQSAISARFQILFNQRELDGMAVVTVMDGDNSKFTADHLPIPPFSRRRVLLSFKPLRQAHYSFAVRFDNLYNPGNCERILVSSFARSPDDHSLVVSHPDLDFGPCYVGMPVSRVMSVRNSTDSPMEIRLSSDCDSVQFHAQSSFDSTNDIIDTMSTSDIYRSDSIYHSRASLLPSGDVSRAHTPPGVAEGRRASFVETNNSADNSDVSVASDGPNESTDLRRSSGANAFSSSFNNQTLPSAGSNNNKDFEKVVIDELILLPGAERHLTVQYLPKRDSTNESLTSFRDIQFRLYFGYTVASRDSSSYMRVVLCKSRICNSIIEVTPRQLNFGEVNVGTLKSSPLRITNISDLPATVYIRFTSKVLNSYRGEMTIPPNQFIETKVDIFPRKVNPNYRKQLMVVNTNNRASDQVVEVLSQNEDRNRVTFHSLFYRIITPTSTNYIDFETVVLNNPTIRSFEIENISDDVLTLELTSSCPDEMQIFTVSDQMKAHAPRFPDTYTKEDIIEAIDDRHHENMKQPAHNDQSQPSPHDESKAEYLDLARKKDEERYFSPRKTSRRLKIITKSRTANQLTEIGGDSSDPTSLDSLAENAGAGGSAESVESPASEATPALLLDMVATLENQESSTIGFAKPILEEKYLKSLISLKKDFERAVESKSLSSVSAVTLPPRSSKRCIMMFTPSGKKRPYIKGKPKKHDSKVYVRLVQFDRGVNAPEFTSFLQSQSDIPVREILVRALLCRSEMEIGQRNINFGLVAKREKLIKSILIYNRSEAQLHYAIRKSGSIASGDVHFTSGKMGLIGAFGKKEVKFVFSPSLPGVFFEKIIVENLQDHSNDQIVNVKAHIRKPSNFFIKSLALNFGNILVESDTVPSSPASNQIVIDNTSKQTRHIEIRYDPKQLSRHDLFNISLDLELTTDNGTAGRRGVIMTREMEDQIEHLEQKLKIAKRKGQDAKVQKITGKLEALRGAPTTELIGDAGQQEEQSSATPITPSMINTPGVNEQSNPMALESPLLALALTEVTPNGGQFRTRRTAESLIVSMEPKTSVAITVILKLSLKSGVNIAGSGSEVKLLLMVHEHKNTDYLKQIELNAMAYARLEDMNSLVPATENSNGTSNAQTPAMSRSTSMGSISEFNSASASGNNSTIPRHPPNLLNSHLDDIYFLGSPNNNN